MDITGDQSSTPDNKIRVPMTPTRGLLRTSERNLFNALVREPSSSRLISVLPPLVHSCPQLLRLCFADMPKRPLSELSTRISS